MSNFKDRVAQAGTKRSEPKASSKTPAASALPQQAQARWPMLQSTPAQKWEILPEMTEQEKENWRMPPIHETVPGHVQPLPVGLSGKLARGLAKMTPERAVPQADAITPALQIPVSRRTLLAKARLTQAEPVQEQATQAEPTPLVNAPVQDNGVSIQAILSRLVEQPANRQLGSLGGAVPRSSFLNRLGKR